MAWPLTNTGMNNDLTQRHSFSNESSGVAFNLGASQVDISIWFSLESAAKPWAADSRPPKPRRGTERGPGTASRSPIPLTLITRPILHPFLSTPLLTLPVTHSCPGHRFLSSACLRLQVCHLSIPSFTAPWRCT
jgi:hypothetical protein